MPDNDRDYLRSRVFDETRAALRADDPHVAAIHVQLAQGYVRSLIQTERSEASSGR